MNDDLNKLALQWQKRRLFAPPKRRRHWPWLLLLLAVVLLPALLQIPLP